LSLPVAAAGDAVPTVNDVTLAAHAAVGALWLLWVISWLLASHWSARTLKTTQLGERTLDLLLTLGGGYCLMVSATPGISARLYPLGALSSWLLAALVACGFGICWWARLYLGRMWSSNITLKQEHQIIVTGPYALVRHPIYTGLLLAAWSTAALQASELGMAGAALMTFGIYLKARREELLLTTELGAPYQSYRQRVPMLLPRIARARMHDARG